MTKPIIVKCKYCGKEVEKDKAYNPKPKCYYCNENHYLSALEKQKQNKKHSFKSPEGSDRRNYTDTIQNLYIYYGWDKDKINWQTIMAQTNRLLKDNSKWTYDTILYILEYEQEILGLQLITKESNWSPLSLVDYHYIDAKKYWEECESIKQSIDGFDFEDKNIIITKTQNYKKKYKEIDLNGI